MNRTIVLALVLTVLTGGALYAGAEPEEGETGAPVRTGQYGEAPMLAAMVAAGELPPVEERLPLEPSVRPLVGGGVDDIGLYGGTLHSAMMNITPWGDLSEMPDAGGSLGAYDANMQLQGDIAKSVELGPDQTSVILHLREGMKWSDGAPLTADDFVFMWEDIQATEGLESWKGQLTFQSIDRIDDYTVELHAAGGAVGDYTKMGLWPGSDWQMYAPKHYLERFFPRYNPDAEALAAELGFADWKAAAQHHYFWHNRQPSADGVWRPVTYPWNYESRDTTVKRFVRNPYYFRVDEEGNQLPYVDRVVISVVADTEVYTARILSGESDVGFMSVAFENFTLFKENEAAGGYRVSALPGFNASDGGVAFNVNNGDPVKKELYQDVRFRQAMSIAIDREDINEVLYAGQGVPRQFTIGPSVSWFNPEWEQAWAQYDPDLANTMLDELGLTQRSSDGTRLMSNGEPLEIVMYVEAGRGDQPTAIGTVELLIDQWADVGVKLILKPVFPETGGDTWWEIDPDTADASFGLIREATEFAATGIMHNVRQADLRWAMGWNEWFYVQNGGTPQGSSFKRDPGSAYSDSPPPNMVEEPPEHWKEWSRNFEAAANMLTGTPEYVEAVTKLYDYHAEQLYLIGTVGLAPQLYIAGTDLGNTPTGLLPWMTWNGELNYFNDQLYFKDASRR